MGWNSVLNVRIPTLQEIDQDSIWIATQIDLTDMHVPGAESYSGKIPRGREYLFPAYWCAISPDVLRENMQAITLQLLVNGEIVPDQDIFTYNYDANSGWHCTYRSVMLSGWKPDSQYVLEVKRTLEREVFDGQSSYAAGSYDYKLVLAVR